MPASNGWTPSAVNAASASEGAVRGMMLRVITRSRRCQVIGDTAGAAPDAPQGGSIEGCFDHVLRVACGQTQQRYLSGAHCAEQRFHPVLVQTDKLFPPACDVRSEERRVG